MERLPRKLILPRLVIAETAEAHDPLASRHTLPDGTFYWTRPCNWPSNKVKAAPELDSFPLVLDGSGIPWDAANLFLLECKSNGVGNPSTLNGLADDLVMFLRFVESAGIDWTVFPVHKNSKPTYRYRGFLIHEVWDGKIKASTAKRRMGAVIRFYRWVMESGKIKLANSPWKETDRLISISRDFGSSKPLRVKTTDLTIPVSVQGEQSGRQIDDGGGLRPLPEREQRWVIETLEALGNTEMLLIHMFALLTGARIQTVLTFKLKPELAIKSKADFVYYAVGPGTGIDTKGGRKMSLCVPKWFFDLLTTYSTSDRRMVRVNKVEGHTHEYLFLSVRGLPMYVSRQDESKIRPYGGRHQRNGQAVRQYMLDYVIPSIKEKYDSDFSYQFHDLRATFGMNLVDQFSAKLAKGETTYTAVLNLVQARMCHSSPVTTERYLNYRAKRNLLESIQADWEKYLHDIAQRATRGNDGADQ